jgi:hypothetical protein
MTPLDTLDTAILAHMQQHPQGHPMSSPEIRRLARSAAKSRQPDWMVIDNRMAALRKAGRYLWHRLGKRYEVVP